MSLLDVFKKPKWEIKTVNELTPEARLGIDRGLFLLIINTGSSYLCVSGRVIGAWSSGKDFRSSKLKPVPYQGGTAWVPE